MKMPKAYDVEKICIEYYKEELDRDDDYSKRYGLLPHERLLLKLQEEFGKAEGEAKFNRWAMWHRPLVEATLEAMETVNEMVRSKKLKKQKSTVKNEKVDKDYLYELSVEAYKQIAFFTNGKKKVNGLLAWESVLKKHVDKRGKEKGLERFREYCQIKRPYIRSLVTVLDNMGLVPKEARSITAK
jgi:hypothetical protein